MPKHDIFVKSSNPLNSTLREFLSIYFDAATIKRLEKHGGRIQISITAPFTRKEKEGKHLIIDNELVHKYIDKVNKGIDIDSELERMSTKDLREFAKLLDFPIRSGANASQLRLEIKSALSSEKRWNIISKGK